MIAQINSRIHCVGIKPAHFIILTSTLPRVEVLEVESSDRLGTSYRLMKESTALVA